MAAPSIILKGLAYLAWGTNGIITAPAGATKMSTVIPESISISPVNSGPVAEIEDGDGFTKGLVLMDNGFNAAVSFVLERVNGTRIIPVLGDTVQLTIEQVYHSSNGAGTAADGVGTAAYNCLVVAAPAIEYPRKGNATIKLTLAHRPLMTLADPT